MSEELNKCGCGEDCGCGHDHDHDSCGCGCGEHESFVIDLEDENGNVVSCPIIDAFEYEEIEYVLAQNPEDGSVYMFRAEGEELVVPEEDEFEKVSKFYNEELADN